MYLAPDVFVLPDDGDRSFVLYAPLLGVVAQINRALADLLETLRSKTAGEVVVEDEGLRGQLLDLGVLSSRPFPDLAPRSARQSYRPTSVSLFLTSACNLGCTYCYASANEKPKSMSWTPARAALDLVFDNAREDQQKTVTVMIHGGGEASLEWELLNRIVEYARQRAKESGIEARMTIGTNGVMSESKAHRIAEAFDGATVSIDGTAEIHNRNRPTVGGKPSYEIVLRTLRIFDQVGLEYGLRMTVTEDDVSTLPEAVGDICRQARAKTIQAEPVFPVGRAERNHLDQPRAAAFVAAFRRAAVVAARYGRRLEYSGARLGEPRDTFCRAAGQSFAVTPTGEVSSCYEVSEAADPRNDLFFWGRYSEASGTYALDEGRRKLQEQLSVHGKKDCVDCFCKWTCAGDCSAKLATLGDPTSTRLNPRCDVNRALTKDLLIRTLRGARETVSKEV